MLLASGSGSVLVATLRLLGHRRGEEKEDSIYMFWSSRDPRARREAPFSLGFRSPEGDAIKLREGGSGLSAMLRLSMTKRPCSETPAGLKTISHSARMIMCVCVKACAYRATPFTLPYSCHPSCGAWGV